MQPMPGYGYGGPPPPQQQYGGAPAAPTYEFNSVENLTIESVAKYARLWGIVSLISGVLTLVMGIVVAVAAGAVAAASAASHSSANPIMSNPAALGAIGVALVPSAIVSIIGGVFYLKSGAALRSVVDTQGDDINLLTNAVRSLSTAFKIEAIAMAVGFVVGLIIGVVTRTGATS